MDRRSWLWRRKSSEKGPGGETESSGIPERLSDDQTLPNIKTQSPEAATSTAASGDGNTIETLSVKLSDALVHIRAKEDLVRKHAKVAEEAVSGWEKAENEVLVLKKQNDTLTRKNSFLEERVGHLDGALKECLRQLRRAREEQEGRIHDAVMKKANEWELKKAEFESQLEGLHTQLQNAKTEADNALSRLAAAEDENSALKAKLLAKAEELEVRTWSTSRVERSLMKSAIGPPVGIDLMDDFLEMERLVALPETTSQDEVEAMIQRGTELEENLKKLKVEKENIEIALNDSQMQLKQTEEKLVEMKTQLALANDAKRKAWDETEHMKLDLQSSTDRLAEENDAKIKVQEELADARMKKEEAELKIKVMDCELETLRSSISAFEKELQSERKFSRETAAKGDQLEAEISRLKLDSCIRSAGVDDFRNQQDEELAATASKFADCQQTIASLSRQLKSLATFEDFLIDPDRSVSVL